MNNITGYTHFRSYHDSIKDLDKEDRRDILEAIDDFMFDDIEPSFTGFKSAIWTLIVPNLTTSKNKSRKYQEEPKKKQTKTKKKSNQNQKETKFKSNEMIDLLEDKDKDKDRDMEKNKEKEEGDILSITNTKNIYEYLEKNFGRTIAPIEAEKLDSWIKDFNFEIVKHAIDSSTISGVKTFNYVEGILRNWKACGYKTLDEIKAHEDSHYNSRIRGKALASELFDYNWLEDEDHD